VQDYFQHIHAMQLKNPQLIGFGISNRDTFQAALANASGAIIGSKFIDLLGNKSNPEEAVVGLLTAIGKA
jgi:tryptophan synthase alpha chain